MKIVVAPGEIALLDQTKTSLIALMGGNYDLIVSSEFWKKNLPDYHEAVVFSATSTEANAFAYSVGHAVDRSTIDNVIARLVVMKMLSRLQKIKLTRKMEIRAFARKHITSPEFGTKSLCREFAVSRATIFRAFEAAGGVHTFLQRQKLDAAILQLWEAPNARGSVKCVSQGAGFEDQYHFSRLCRRIYGLKPSAVLAIDARTT